MSYLLESQRTTFVKDQELKQEWTLVDANEQTLGRLAARIAHRLRGKHRPDYAPHQNNGDHVVVLNAAGIKVTGKKMEQKLYHHHSHFPGGLKTLSLKEKMEKEPTYALKTAVKRMLPKGPMGRKLLRQLWIYPGTEHPHQAQQPRRVEKL